RGKKQVLPKSINLNLIAITNPFLLNAHGSGNDAAHSNSNTQPHEGQKHSFYGSFSSHFTKICFIGSTSLSISPAPAVTSTSPNSLSIFFANLLSIQLNSSSLLISDFASSFTLSQIILLSTPSMGSSLAG